MARQALWRAWWVIWVWWIQAWSWLAVDLNSSGASLFEEAEEREVFAVVGIERVDEELDGGGAVVGLVDVVAEGLLGWSWCEVGGHE